MPRPEPSLSSPEVRKKSPLNRPLEELSTACGFDLALIEGGVTDEPVLKSGYRAENNAMYIFELSYKQLRVGGD